MPCFKSEIRRARKDYECDAYHWISNSNFGEHDFSPEDWELVNGFDGVIKEGDMHLYSVGTYEGEFYTSRSNQDMHKICLKYDLYYD